MFVSQKLPVASRAETSSTETDLDQLHRSTALRPLFIPGSRRLPCRVHSRYRLFYLPNSGMAHVPRWPRRKKDVAPPTLITTDLSGNNNNSSPSSNKLAAAVAAPAESQPAAAPAPVPSPGQVRSSLHKLKGVFHRSAKRARDSPPASLPHSPAAAPVSVATGNGNGNSNGGNSNGNLNVNVSEIRPVSPLSLKTDAASTMEKATKTPKMPAFLDLPKQGMFVFPCSIQSTLLTVFQKSRIASPRSSGASVIA